MARSTVVPGEQGNRPLTPLTQLQQAIAQQMTAGAAPTPQEALQRLAAAGPSSGQVSLPVAVAALAAEDHYLAASSQEALLLCFAGDAGAAQISRGAAAMQSSRPTPRRKPADSLTPGLDAHVAHVAGATAGAPRARGRGRRGRGGRGRGRQQHRPPSGDPAAPTQIDAGTDSETLGPAALTASARPSRAHATPLHRHLPCLRETDLRAEFEHRVYTFQSPPRQLRGLLRNNALRVSLEAIRDDAGTDTERDGWKLFFLAPRMLLFRTPGVAHVPPQEFKRRERLFCEGSWAQLLRESVAAAQRDTVVRQSHHRSALRVTSGAVLTEPPRSRTSGKGYPRSLPRSCSRAPPQVANNRNMRTRVLRTMSLSAMPFGVKWKVLLICSAVLAVN